MSSWINEAAVPNHNGNGFPHLNNDPSAMMDPSAFMGNPAQFNPQFANAQQMAAMQNGQMRNASPSFQNPMYQTSQVIPSKRPRPREDSMGQSPRQAPGMVPTSRSETPQQSPFPGFQPQPNMPPHSSGQPSPYPHLANGSANATPSPIMGNQMRPGSVPQRVSTTSPHPFSPAAQQFPRPSPVPSEHGGTPQPNAYMQPNNYQQGFNSQYPAQSPARPTPSPGAMSGQMMPQQMAQMPQQMGQMPQQQMGGQMGGQMPQQMGGQMPGQMGGQMPGQMPSQMYAQGQGMPQARNSMEQQRLAQYQMQLQQQARSNMHMQQMQGQNVMQAQAQQLARQQMMARQGMPNGQMPHQMPPGARPPQGMPQPQQEQRPQAGQGVEQFMKNLAAFMAQKGQPLDPNPMVDGRPIHLMMLFQVVNQKFGGYKLVSERGQWLQVAQMLKVQAPTGSQQLKAVYERNLYHFEEWWHNSQKMRMQQQGQPGVPMNAMRPQPPQATPTKAMSPAQIQPGQMMPQAQQAQMQQGQMQTPGRQHTPQQPSVNGFPTPIQAHHPPTPVQSHSRSSFSNSVQATPTGEDFPIMSPAQGKPPIISIPGPTVSDGHSIDTQNMTPFPPKSEEPEDYKPGSREIVTYGGIDMATSKRLADELDRWRPDVPPGNELGNIDVHALSKSIQSGIHGEVRVALDTLATVTHAVQPNLLLDLRYCDDLVETLIECAEEQVELLAENTEEASNEIAVTPYEDVIRAVHLEKVTIQKVRVIGTPEYNLDRAADRLICITTILRNLSFHEENQHVLSDDFVVKFLCVVIRYLGTRENLLRTHSNTLDFMKDLVILLSNIAGSVEIPGREQAVSLLYFLLAFAPTPGPTISEDRLFFPSYEPLLHPYLPHAVDALAKLLARDEPNRTQYQSIFTPETPQDTTPIPDLLLTRAFALAIAPIPDQAHEARAPNLPFLVDVRKPYLMQGLLAAEILASLAPGHESGVTRAWLSSGNGFAQNLFMLIRQLSAQFESQVRSGPVGSRSHHKRDMDLVYLVSLAVGMLRRLSERARDPTARDKGIPPNVLPSRDSVLGALSMVAPEWTRDGMLADLVAYAGLED